MSSSSASNRLAAVSGQLSASNPKGLLAGDVAIITGVSTPSAITLRDSRGARATADPPAPPPPPPPPSSSQAAQGIGRSCALLFATEGAKVVVSDLDEAKAQKVVDEIKQAGGQAIAVGGDVTADGFAKKVVDAAVSAFGSVEHIVANAGFTSDKVRPFSLSSLECALPLVPRGSLALSHPCRCSTP